MDMRGLLASNLTRDTGPKINQSSDLSRYPGDHDGAQPSVHMKYPMLQWSAKQGGER